MNRPPPPHMMGNMYRGPRPFNNRWRPRGPHPPPGFPCRPNNYYRTPVTNTKDNEEHWCETCDRGFPTADLLDKHKQQHQVNIQSKDCIEFIITLQAMLNFDQKALLFSIYILKQ